MNGWFKLYRKLTGWEWFSDSYMVHIFIYLIAIAFSHDGTWQGISVKRGQAIIGRKKLSDVTGISQQSVRTCLKKLEMTNEITIRPTSKYTLVTLLNYDKYQGRTMTHQPTSDQINQQINQQTNQQSTNRSTNRSTSNECGATVRNNSRSKEHEIGTNQQTNQQSTSGSTSRSTSKLTTSKEVRSKEVKEKDICVQNFNFEKFWSAYPKKRKKLKARAIWDKKNLSNGSFGNVMAGLERAKQSDGWQQENGKWIPLPTTWLNGEEWNDEYTVADEDIQKKSQWVKQ